VKISVCVAFTLEHKSRTVWCSGYFQNLGAEDQNIESLIHALV